MDWMLGTSILSIVPFCTAVGLWHEYFAVSGTCFVFCISLLCYLTVTQGSKAAEAMKWWYFVYALGLPALFTLALVMSAKILDRGNMIGDATFEWVVYLPRKLFLNYFV
ncbi:hypothetical protein BC830DRAFT_1097476 [Chytriomyces sp. MP71]|nr:hypothetical protein BC830DRAFT_1097476 [Chytriomyces sp. MP71]